MTTAHSPLPKLIADDITAYTETDPSEVYFLAAYLANSESVDRLREAVRRWNAHDAMRFILHKLNELLDEEALIQYHGNTFKGVFPHLDKELKAALALASGTTEETK